MLMCGDLVFNRSQSTGSLVPKVTRVSENNKYINIYNCFIANFGIIPRKIYIIIFICLFRIARRSLKFL